MSKIAKQSDTHRVSVFDLVKEQMHEGKRPLETEVSATNELFAHICFDAETHQAKFLDHEHCTVFLSLNVTGRVEASYDGEARSNELSHGMFHLAPTGILQEYDFEGRTTNIALSIHNRLFDELRDHNPELSNARIDEPMRGFTNSSLSRLIIKQNRLIRSGEMGWRSLADANIIQLGIELLKLSTSRKIASAAPLTKQEIAQTENYLRAHLDVNIPLADIAELTGRDVFGFSRAFKSATGKTFHQFALQLRVDEAVRLLTKTSMTLAEVALETGFSSQSHMTTTMRKMTGHTPGEMRRKS